MRALKAIVIGMAVLLVLGFGALVVAMVDVGRKGGPNPPSQPGPPFALDLPAPPGTRLQGVDAVGGRLILRFAGDAGTRLVVVDPETGRVTGTIVVAVPAP